MLCYTEYSSGDMNSRQSYGCNFAAALNAMENSLELQKRKCFPAFFPRDRGRRDCSVFSKKKRCFVAKFGHDVHAIHGPNIDKDSNPKCRLFLKIDCKSSWRQVFIYLRPPVPLYLFTQGRGVGEPVRRLQVRQFTRGVENTNTTDCISGL